MNTNNQNTAGRGFRVNNPPSASFAPGAGEVCDRGASAEQGTTHGQINDRRSFSTKLRNYNRTIWTIAEKTVIYNCFIYSRHECWGRKKNESPKNKITAINQMATPVLSYGFGIIEWPQRDIDNLDTKTRKILTIHK